MTTDQSVRRARVCAAASVILFLAVLIVGGSRSARETRPAPAQTQPPDAQIAVFYSDRNTLRQEEISQLLKMASDPSASDSMRASAQERVMLLRKWMEQEATVETVLSARGYETPVVTVHSDSVNVIVRASELTRQQAGVILELVTRETGVTGGNVKIIPIN